MTAVVCAGDCIRMGISASFKRATLEKAEAVQKKTKNDSILKHLIRNNNKRFSVMHAAPAEAGVLEL